MNIEKSAIGVYTKLMMLIISIGVFSSCQFSKKEPIANTISRITLNQIAFLGNTAFPLFRTAMEQPSVDQFRLSYQSVPQASGDYAHLINPLPTSNAAQGISGDIFCDLITGKEFGQFIARVPGLVAFRKKRGGKTYVNEILVAPVHHGVEFEDRASFVYLMAFGLYLCQKIGAKQAEFMINNQHARGYDHFHLHIKNLPTGSLDELVHRGAIIEGTYADFVAQQPEVTL